MSDHTAGPWAAEVPPPDAYTDPDILLDPSVAFWIAETRPAGEVLAHILQTSQGDAEANARLIAAAPDLLAACRVALGPAAHFATEFDDEEPWNALRAAIAKAEGQ